MQRSEAGRCEQCNAGWREAMGVLFEQRPLAESLAMLCRQCGSTDAGRQVAIFLQDGEKWNLAARGPLTARAEAAIKAIEPRRLSESVLASHNGEGPARGFSFAQGWARSLESGAGELLGLMVNLADGPMAPAGENARRIDFACHAAAVAIEQRNLLEELAFRAGHDELTGLLNRAAFERALSEEVERGGPASLLCINLDRFRMMNEVLGHAAGDRLLEQVGKRFQSCLREDDAIARVGGDEFAVLLRGVDTPPRGEAAAARLLRALEAPFWVDGNELYVSASAGVVCLRPDSTSEMLEREAFVALYHAKGAGKARAMHYVPSMASTPPERLEMEKRLRFALDRGELVLYYQPQIALGPGTVDGAEVLLRWRPENLGVVSPGAFIPILEETGLIVDFGRWVLREACRQGVEWLRRNGRAPRLGVNVSAVQFQQLGYIEDVKSALAETGFPPGLLELELTESLFVGDFGSAARTFAKLHEMGISLALDDFGTGQSSLSYLQYLPFQRLKIDQSFVRSIADGDACPPLVESILRIAGDLGLATIAEGVESAHQAELLCRAGCSEGQGYYFAKPLPAGEFLEYYRRGPEPSSERTAEASSP